MASDVVINAGFFVLFFSSFSNLVRLSLYLRISVSCMIRILIGETVNIVAKQLTWVYLTNVKIN